MSISIVAVRSEALPDRHRRGRRVTAAQHDRSAHPPQRRAGGETTSARGDRPVDLAGLTVVVVDDDADTLDYFAMALMTSGARVVTASTAADGVALVRERRPQAVVSDIAMVEHDGYWLVDQIRGTPDDIRHVPIVAVTAYGAEHSRERALAAGFDEHLRKPVDPDVLCRTVAGLAQP